jgi:A/G-specific adenine glycosylase
MLQQTQVATVIPYYLRWLQAFPSLAAVAAADEEQVLKLWEGLGYYSRARNFQRAARIVLDCHGGEIPRTKAEFSLLPGVGHYTTHAVLSLAFGRPLAVVDGNVKRVIARLVALDCDIARPTTLDTVQRLADVLLGRSDPALHNQAMMELGALVCRPRDPQCESCPARRSCGAAGPGAERFPIKVRRKTVPHHDLVLALLNDGERWLLRRRPAGGMLAGLWDLPSVRRGLDADADPALLRRMLLDQYGLRIRVGDKLAPVKHSYTHLKVTLHPYRCTVQRAADHAAEPAPGRFLSAAELQQYALPKATQSVLKQIGLR